MSNVFGKAEFVVSQKTENESETLALLEANYKLHKDNFIAFELYGIDSNGNKVFIPIHDCLKIELDEVV